MPRKSDHQYTTTGNLEKLFSEGHSTAQIAETIGASDSTISGWRREKRMPVLASMACEAVIRRNGRRAKRRMALVCVPAEYESMLKTFLSGIPNSQYLLIEEPRE
jgi:IS30 family transposase